MSIHEDGKMPSEATLLSVIDTGARKTMATARDAIAPIVSREVPKASGKTAAALRPRIARTSTGAALTVGAPRGKRHDGSATIADVVRWVQRGTGLYRTTPGPKRRIRSKRFPRRRLILPGGRKVWSVKGQHPNPFMQRIEQLGTPRVQKVCEEGARDAARAVERTVR